MYESPKTGSLEIKGAYKGSTPARRCYVGGTLVYQGFSPASEQEFIQQEATGGPAQLLKVYGKTIVNNQLVQNGDFSDGLTNWVAFRGTAAFSSGVVSVTSDGTGNLYLYQNAVFPSNNTHSFLLCANVNPSSNAMIGFSYWSLDFGDSYQSVPQNQWVRIYYIANPDTQNNPNKRRLCVVMRNATNGEPSAGDVLRLKGDISCVDLTLRFGAGNEPTSVDEALRLLGGDAFDPTYDPGSLQSDKIAELRAYDGGTLRGSLALNLSTLTGKLNGEGASVVVYPDGLRGVGTDRDAAYGSTGEVGILKCSSLKSWANRGTYSWDYSGINYRGVSFSNILPLNCLRAAYKSVIFGQALTSGIVTPNQTSFLWVGVGSRIVYHLMSVAYASSIGVYDSVNDKIDLTAYNSWLQGVDDNIIYAIATPLTYTLDTPLPTDLTCEQGDILQRVSDNNCPFVGEMKFGL